jgi:hypothetical protein
MIEDIKQCLVTASVLALPSMDKPFHLFVNVGRGRALESSPKNMEGRNSL